MSNKNPYSVVYLMGGFGNQLFQLCFANNLRKRGHIVSIDSTNYTLPNDGEISKREIIIPVKDFESEIISVVSRKTLKKIVSFILVSKIL